MSTKRKQDRKQDRKTLVECEQLDAMIDQQYEAMMDAIMLQESRDSLARQYHCI